MAIRSLFGIHEITPYNLTTGVPYGHAKVLAGSTFTVSGESIKLTGGSSKYPFQIEDGLLESVVNLTMREYPNWAFELFLGKALTSVAADADGNVSTLVNKNGTSAFDASTGTASVAALAGSEANLKFGKYTALVTSADTLGLYASTDVDFARGTDASYDDDNLISSVVIPDSGATVDVTDLGLQFTGGSGTVAMTTGDTFTFEVRPINDGSESATFGSTTDTFSNFGLHVVAQRQGDGKLFALDIFKVRALGMPLGFSANEFSEFEVSAEAAYDSDRNGVFSMEEIRF